MRLEPQASAGISRGQLSVGMLALVLYAAAATGAIEWALTYSKHFAVDGEQLRAGSPSSLEVTLRLKEMPRSLYGTGGPRLSLISVSGPPYLYQDFDWATLHPEGPPEAGAVYQLRLPVNAALDDALRRDGKLRWSLHWSGASIRAREVSR